jgi:hypothetical protein
MALFGLILGETLKNGVETLIEGKAKKFEIQAQALAYEWIAGAVALRGLAQAGIG